MTTTAAVIRPSLDETIVMPPGASGEPSLLTSVPDNWGGPMRSIIFWWLLGHMGRDWWARYLDKYGSPFVVGKYDQGMSGTDTSAPSNISFQGFSKKCEK